MSDDYSGFEGMIQDVVKAACLGDVTMNGWVDNGNGTITFAAVGLGGGSESPVAGPGHGYPDDLLNPTGSGPTGTGPDGQLRDPSTTVGQVYSIWEAEVPKLFEPFIGMPDPDDFQGLADEVREALKQLSSDGATGSGDSTDTDQSSANIDYEGNSTLGLASQAAQQLNSWQGNSARAFATYLNLFTVVVGNQALASEALRITLLEEKELWARMREDAVAFAMNAESAFNQVGDLGLDDLKAILSVAGTINTVLGWFPAFKPVTGPAGTALSVAGVLVDTLGGEEPPPNDLASRGPFDVLKNCQEHRDKLKELSQTVEGDIKKSLENIKEHIEAAPPARTDGSPDQPSYTLDRPNETYNADSYDDFIYGTLDINPQSVTDTADILDKDIGAEMQTASTSLDAGDNASPWYRDSSEIGAGGGLWGCYSEYSAASTLLQHEIGDTAKEMDWAAEMLRFIAANMKNHDENIGKDFGGVRKEIDEYDNPTPVPHAYPPGKMIPQ